jgi:DNA (cytosine-5)-methyltransferase 1
MNYLSVCSGIEAATVAWHDLGWKPVGFSEIEKFPAQVLAHHYPQVTNFGDMTKYKDWNINDTVGLLVGGTPCQSFSVAGLRKGLEDPRGNLALTYVGILDKFRPKWAIWENVPGVLSSNKGRDFGAFLGALVELGYGWSYRVLDAQYFGVAQRRRRVFVVCHFGDWKPAAKVLFESESLFRNPKKGGIKGQEVAATITARFGNSRNNHEELAPVWPATTASTLNASFGNKLGLENQHINSGAPLFVPAYVSDVSSTLTASGAGFSRPGHTSTAHENYIAIQGNLIGRDKGGPNGVGVSENSPMFTLTKTDVHAVAFGWQNSSSQSMTTNVISPTLDKSKTPAVAFARQPIPEYYAHQYCQDRVYSTEGITPALNCSQAHKFRFDMSVRRLTEVECERLQGFPDNYTNIRENCPSGARYKALGNSMAVPVMRWIGERINKYERGSL